MIVESIKMPYSNVPYYRASINKRGISVALSARTRREAIARTLEEFFYQLYR